MNSAQILKRVNPRKIILPIALGLLVVSWLIYREFDSSAWAEVEWGWKVALGAFFALVCMFVRDLAYVYRLRSFTDGKLSWYRSLIVILIWEFASAITPSIVGGTAVALYVLTKEKISAGRSTAIVFASIFLDEAFFILMAPIAIFWVGIDNLFFSVDEAATLLTGGRALLAVFWTGYFIIFIYTAFLFYGLFIKPKGFRSLIVAIFSIPILKRWRRRAYAAGEDILITSAEFRTKTFGFWAKNSIATIASWTGRYFVVNVLLWAFYSGQVGFNLFDHMVIYARQITMWVILLISPTPGGSGVAEALFKHFLIDYCPDKFSAAIAFFWRLISYFPYLILGAIIFPKWIQRHVKLGSIRIHKKNNKA